MSGSQDRTVRGSAYEPGADPATVFAALARIVYAPTAVDDVVVELCRAAPVVVPGCDHASLMLRRSDRFFTAASSDDVARAIDEAEIELEDGPCMDAILDEAAQFDPDLTSNAAWPRLAEWVLANTPVRGSLGYRLIIDDHKVGALNLFSDTPGALTTVAVDEAAIFAAFASVAVSAARHNERAETLQAGLDSNREIGKAIGLLMAMHNIDDDQAFEMLSRVSQEMNIKVAEVASQVIEHHRKEQGRSSS